MHDILLQIIKKKEKDLREQEKILSPDDVRKKAAGKISASNFKDALLRTRGSSDAAIIAEIKLASPTIPSLGSESEILERAIAYERAGATAVSVVTEKHYFKGSTAFISKLKTVITIPILQKDFVIDPYQIYEAKTIGSDAILLIARLVAKDILKELVRLALEIGIEPVVEIHDKEDLEKAVTTNTVCIAVNARNLDTFAVNIFQACTLLEKVPEGFIKLGFSGIQSSSEVRQYKKAGACGVLVGTSLMETENIAGFMRMIKTL